MEGAGIQTELEISPNRDSKMSKWWLCSEKELLDEYERLAQVNGSGSDELLRQYDKIVEDIDIDEVQGLLDFYEKIVEDYEQYSKGFADQEVVQASQKNLKYLDHDIHTACIGNNNGRREVTIVKTENDDGDFFCKESFHGHVSKSNIDEKVENLADYNTNSRDHDAANCDNFDDKDNGGEEALEACNYVSFQGKIDHKIDTTHHGTDDDRSDSVQDNSFIDETIASECDEWNAGDRCVDKTDNNGNTDLDDNIDDKFQGANDDNASGKIPDQDVAEYNEDSDTDGNTVLEDNNNNIDEKLQGANDDNAMGKIPDQDVAEYNENSDSDDYDTANSDIDSDDNLVLSEKGNGGNGQKLARENIANLCHDKATKYSAAVDAKNDNEDIVKPLHLILEDNTVASSECSVSENCDTAEIIAQISKNHQSSELSKKNILKFAPSNENNEVPGKYTGCSVKKVRFEIVNDNASQLDGHSINESECGANKSDSETVREFHASTGGTGKRRHLEYTVKMTEYEDDAQSLLNWIRNASANIHEKRLVNCLQDVLEMLDECKPFRRGALLTKMANKTDLQQKWEELNEFVNDFGYTSDSELLFENLETRWDQMLLLLCCRVSTLEDETNRLEEGLLNRN